MGKKHLWIWLSLISACTFILGMVLVFSITNRITSKSYELFVSSLDNMTMTPAPAEGWEKEDYDTLLDTLHLFWIDENHGEITALAPAYTQDGNFAGLFNLSFPSAPFRAFHDSVLYLILLLFTLPALILVLLFLLFFRRYNRRIFRSFQTDELTGLYTRKHYSSYYESAVAYLSEIDGNIGVIMADIDNFKACNDTFGHSEGDAILKQVAKVLTDIASAGNGIAGRFGGEEFLLILPDASHSSLDHVCESIREQVMALHIQNANTATGPWLTVSLGACLARADKNLTLKQLIDTADGALYEIKHNEKNNYKILTFNTDTI